MNPSDNNHSQPPNPRTPTLAPKVEPEEILGLSGPSRLPGAILVSTIAAVAVLVGFTVPFALSSHPGPEKAVSMEPAKTETAEPIKAPPKPASSAPEKTRPASHRDALDIDKLGTNDTKTADPKSNPLDKRTDDIFKGLDRK